MIVAAVILLLVLIGLLPVGVRLTYGQAGGQATVQIGPWPIRIYPKATGGKSDQSAEAQKEKTATAQHSGGKLSLFRELLGILLDILGCLKRKLRIKHLLLHLTVGGRGEEAEAAILYGRAWAAVGALTPVLENLFTVANRDIQVMIDFTAEENIIYGEADVRVRLGDILWIGLYHGLRAIGVVMKQRRKGRKKHGTSN